MDSFTVVVSCDPDTGVYTAFCPAMPGAIAEASSHEAVLRAVADVMGGWLEAGLRDGYVPREETPSLVSVALAETLEDRQAEGWDLSVETTIVAPAVLTAA